MDSSTCPECTSDKLYRSVPTSAFGSNEVGQTIFPGLAGRLSKAKFTVLACENCGYSRLFLCSDARAKLSSSPHWRRTIS